MTYRWLSDGEAVKVGDEFLNPVTKEQSTLTGAVSMRPTVAPMPNRPGRIQCYVASIISGLIMLPVAVLLLPLLVLLVVLLLAILIITSANEARKAIYRAILRRAYAH